MINVCCKKGDVEFLIRCVHCGDSRKFDLIKELVEAKKEARKEGAITSEIKVLKEFKELLNKLEGDYEFGNDGGFKYPKYLLEKRVELTNRLKELQGVKQDD